MKRHWIFWLILFPFVLQAQSNGVLLGKVQQSDQERPLSAVIVRIQGKDISTKTDENGQFYLSDVPPGKYYLIFIKTGFYSLIIPDVEVRQNKRTNVSVKMFPGDEQQFLFLEIGGIQVTAQRELLPEEPETVHKITSGEIEHMQANSLADVLDMIPGNEKTGNLGLKKKQNINIRNMGDLSSLFGTRIILDDVPLSNNADLQTGDGVANTVKVAKSAETEYDLREIVADNLEKVEVQSGASSVEYGDNTSGVIVVRTRSRNIPTRFKFKNNPDTKEANLMGSFRRWKTNFIYNFNYGYSERDIRIHGDEFHRLVGSLKAQNQLFDNRVTLQQKLRYSRKIEEDNDASDPNQTRAYNRDFHITYSQQFDWKWNEVTRFYLRNYLDYKHRNSWKHKLESRDLSYATDLTHPGTREGILTDPVYFSDVTTRGEEWAYGLKFKGNRRFFTGPVLHRILGGLEYQREWNSGPGKQFDLLYPPNGAASIRPRSFNDIPGISQLAIFAEDRLTGKWLVPFTINVGFRVDSYNPKTFAPWLLFKGEDAFRAAQGTFFNPRAGIKLQIASGTQLRFTYGKSSKTPSLSMIYPEKMYLDVSDIGIVRETLPDGRDTSYTVPLITTYVFDRTAKDLKGFQSTKFEAGVDQRWGNVGLSVVGYYQETKDIPYRQTFPLRYNKYLWPEWPSPEGKQVTEEVLLASSKYKLNRNLNWVKNSGVELSLRTHRIPRLNMRFRVSAAFTFSKTGSKDYPNYATNARKFSAGDTLSSGWVVPRDMYIVPYYVPTRGWRQRTVINYKIDYIAKTLGIWLTVKAQQVLWDMSLLKSNPVKEARGYYEDGKNIPIDAETSHLMGLDKSYSIYDITVSARPNDKWLFSVVVSKSLFRGAEISLFVDNILNDRAYYVNRLGSYSARNPEMFWGIAFSAVVNGLFKR
ncbi:MAG TPA: TonB-dependent receptor [Caldithrix abyssi]|uniref:TonB-dependent receptor n=1 Tax=Caldithrix abyssi TaxID=187145 RepID=A0A7V5UEW4_CALAY|nr:TonB-dependent receptor [Caldithrix abyssi]